MSIKTDKYSTYLFLCGLYRMNLLIFIAELALLIEKLSKNAKILSGFYFSMYLVRFAVLICNICAYCSNSVNKSI